MSRRTSLTSVGRSGPASIAVEPALRRVRDQMPDLDRGIEHRGLVGFLVESREKVRGLRIGGLDRVRAARGRASARKASSVTPSVNSTSDR